MLTAVVDIEVFSPTVVSEDSDVEAVVAIFTQPVVSYLSYVSVDVLYLSIPVTPVGLLPVVLFGSVNAPVAPEKLTSVSVRLKLLADT